MKVRLYRDLHQHSGGKVIKHKAGTEVDLPNDVAEYVNRAVIEQRKRVRAVAEHFTSTLEFKRKR